MASISGYIKTRLKLVVNREKNQVARSYRVKFLGFIIVGETIAIAHKALQGAMSNTRAVTKAYPNGWFIAVQGQATRSDRELAHWFDVDRWIRLA